MVDFDVVHTLLPTVKTAQGLERSRAEAARIDLRRIHYSRPSSIDAKMVEAVLNPCPLICDGKLFVTLDEGEGTFKDRILVWAAQWRKSCEFQHAFVVWDQDSHVTGHLPLSYTIGNGLRIS